MMTTTRHTDIVNLFHVNFQVVCSFKDLATSLARMRDKSALVLVSDMSEQRTLQVKNTSTHGALEFRTVRSLAHGVDRVCVGQSL